jgi:hypothetical protein
MRSFQQWSAAMRHFLLPLTLLLSTPCLAQSSPQVGALWNRIATLQDFNGVDQIIFEGDVDGPALTGTLQKRDWLGTGGTVYSKRFSATATRTCFADVAGCYQIRDLTANGVKLPD